MSLISVVIPIYNAESYIKKCIDSVLGQTYSEIEVILVNDGSTDRSYDICMKESGTDTRIKLFQQKNGGVSSARKLGVQCASGEYIFFLDADDSIASNTLEVLYDKAKEGYDIVQCGCCYDMEYNGDEFIKRLLLRNAPFAIWGKLIRKNLLDSIDLFIPRSINVGEDLILNIRLGVVAQRIYSMSGNYYNYSYHSTSVTINRVISVDYEKLFLSYLSSCLKDRWSDIEGLFNYFGVGTIENLLVSNINIDYQTHWIKDILDKASLLKLSRREWLVVHIRKASLCRFLLRVEKRVTLWLNFLLFL